MNMQANTLSKAALLALALAAPGARAAAPAPAPAVSPVAPATAPAVFARIGESVITQADYSLAFSAAARAKFYHGKPPDAEIAQLQREVGDKLVLRVLLLREAKQRGMGPDQAEIAKTVQVYEKRYAGSEQWTKNKAQMLPPLVARLGEENLLEQLERTVRAAARKPIDGKSYYAAHQDQFTEPERLRVALILLKVEPSAPTATWIATDAKAQALVVRARAGEDFAALARKFSADPSAAKGGDMGYIHGGMLPEGTIEALAKLKPGEPTESLRVLQGLAVLRLIERKPARLMPYDAVKTRAAELAEREQGESAWSAFVLALRAKTPAQVDQSRFLPLAAAASAKKAQ